MTGRTRAALGVELLAFSVTVGIAIGLGGDERATMAHQATLWAASVAAAVPFSLTIVGTESPAFVDSLVAVLVLWGIAGTFTIGGIALMVPAFFLALAGLLHWLATPRGASRRRVIFKGMIVFGVLLTVGGIATLSIGMVVAPLGIFLIVWGLLEI